MKQVNISKLDSTKVKAQKTGGTYDGSYGKAEATPAKDIPENSPEQEATSVEEPAQGTPKETSVIHGTSVIEPNEGVVMAPDCDKEEQGTTGTYDGSYGKSASAEDEDKEDEEKEEDPDMKKTAKKASAVEEEETPASIYKKMATAPLPKMSGVPIFGLQDRTVKVALGKNKKHIELNEAFVNNWQAMASELFKQ